MDQFKIQNTERQFSRAAQTYDSSANIHRNIATYLTAHARFPDISGYVLDIGSGTGILSSNLVKLFQPNQIVNLDLSMEMLRQAQEKFPMSLFIQANMAELPLLNSFNNVVSSTALQWLESPEEIAKCLKSSLSPHGYFACSVVVHGTFDVITSIRRDILGGSEPDNQSQAEKLPIFEKLKKSFKDFGLQLERSEKHSFIQSYDSIDGPFNAIKNLGISGGSKRKLSKEELELLKNRYATYCTENSLAPYLNYQIGFFWGTNNGYTERS